MRFFDSHAHYNDTRFVREYPGGYENALRDAVSAGAAFIMNVGSSLQSSEESVNLAERFGFVYASVGLHPCDALVIPPEKLDNTLERLISLSKHEKVCAWGEVGLDYHWNPDEKEQQKEIFDKQLSIAESLSLPVIIHDREAHGDCLDIAAAHPKLNGVFHSFSGSAEMARQLTRKGWYVSFSGPVTYKNAHNVREAAEAVPEELLLVETDTPYLPPVPFRGKINTSAYLPYTIRALAEARETDAEILAETTLNNALRFYRIKQQ